MSIETHSDDEELELMKQCLIKEPSQTPADTAVVTEPVADQSPLSSISDKEEFEGNCEVDVVESINATQSPVSEGEITPGSAGEPPQNSAKNEFQPQTTSTSEGSCVGEDDPCDENEVAAHQESVSAPQDTGDENGLKLPQTPCDQEDVCHEAELYPPQNSEDVKEPCELANVESHETETPATGAAVPVIQSPVSSEVQPTVFLRPLKVPAPQVPAPQVDSQPVIKPVRGRVFTEPAWKTANLLLVAKESQSDLSHLERKLGDLKNSITDLENAIRSRLKDREMLQREISHLESRPRIKPQAITLPPWLRPVQQPSPPSLVQSGSTSKTFVIDFQRRNGEPLGLRLTYMQTTGQFVIEEVKDTGAVPSWNATARTPVCVGDIIVRVNNTSDPIKMKAEFGAPNIRMTIERPTSRNVTQSIPVPPARPSAVVNRTLWPQRSVEVYEEVLHALANKASRDQPRTGIMNCEDVPIKLPDDADGTFRCSLCRVALRNEQEYTSHMRSQKHETQKEQVESRDFWTRCNADEGQTYWYENTIGLWSIDDPGRAGTGSHTVIS